LSAVVSVSDSLAHKLGVNADNLPAAVERG
jgi:hypothetical protein